jgi:NADPH-dependent curcumin reductase CurA
MPDTSRRIVLRSRPRGPVAAENFETLEVPRPEIGPGEALLRTTHVSVDPTNRGWLDDAPGYLPPVGIGEPVRAVGLARVVESATPDLRVGDLVHGFVGWQEHVVATPDGPAFTPVRGRPGVSDSAHLGVFGITGLTAWLGIQDICRPAAGETVVVSAAAGAVGSIAGQIAKARGARVVGIAGGPEKCRLLRDELGFDAAVDYRAPTWRDDLDAATPDGIDCDFENVGGPVMEAVLARLNLHARVALCGLVSVYDGEREATPVPDLRTFVSRRTRLEGFLVLDHLGRMAEAGDDLARWIHDGSVRPLETVVDGFERLPEALTMLFAGKNVGKLIVRLGDA